GDEGADEDESSDDDKDDDIEGDEEEDESFDDEEDDDIDINGDEYLAPADSIVVTLPAVAHAPSAEETEPQTPISLPSDTEIARLMAIPTPPSSSLSPLSSPLPQIPSRPLPLLSPPPIDPTYEEVKENQEKDKIRSKPDKNGKRSEVKKIQKQLQLKEEEKPKKTKKEWPKTHARIKSY
nr:hypothetical protein [Tanacetum cinerariifolium]